MVGEQQRLVLYEGQNYQEVVSDFGRKYDLCHKKQARLMQIIKEQLNTIQMPPVDEHDELN